MQTKIAAGLIFPMLSDMRQTRRQFLKTAVAGSAILPGAAGLGFADTSTVTAPTVSPKDLARPPNKTGSSA
jgi:hypothetical protein